MKKKDPMVFSTGSAPFWSGLIIMPIFIVGVQYLAVPKEDRADFFPSMFLMILIGELMWALFTFRFFRSKIILLNENEIKVVRAFRSFIVRTENITYIEVLHGWRGNKHYNVYNGQKFLFDFGEEYDDHQRLYSILNARKRKNKKEAHDEAQAESNA